MNKQIKEFTEYWRSLRIHSEIDISELFNLYAARYWKGEIRKIPERMLQTYLFFNIESFFPDCKELLLYERPLVDRKSTNLGRLDFAFLTSENKIRLIETKVIDTESSGRTASCRRRRHRQKLAEQVLRGKRLLSYCFQIPLNLIECSVFTTDSHMNDRVRWYCKNQIDCEYISMSNLRRWFQEAKTGNKNSYDSKLRNLSVYDQSYGWP